MSKFSIALLVSALASFFFGEQGDESRKFKDFSDAEEVRWVIPGDPPGIVQVDGDTSKTKNPNNRVGDVTHQPYVTPLSLPDPSNLQTQFILDDSLQGYSIYEKMGDIHMRRPSWISFEDYLKYRNEKDVDDYYREKSMASNSQDRKGLIPSFDLGEVSDIFGGGTVEIRPTGFATLSFSLDQNKTENPSLPLRQQRVTSFNFDQQIQLGVQAKIGELMKFNTTFDTKATFDFENELKLQYSGKEDQILQKIEAGNVSMPLGNTLIQGRLNLFGLKTALKFGPVMVTAVASTERGKVETVSVAGGGAVETPFTKEVAEYDEYRHYFLAHYFRSRYEPALRNLPQISSTIRINRIEVWINNARGSTTQNNRNAIGFVDLGENELRARDGGQGLIFNDSLLQPSNDIRFPDNNANSLYQLATSDPVYRDYRAARDALQASGMREGLDYERVNNMRKLDPNEYTIESQLGYISLNQKTIANQVLFIAYEYTYNGQNYQVGDFSQDVPANGSGTNVLFLKMLKPASVKPNYTDNSGTSQLYPAWDLMMKNIYNIGYGISRDNFFLDILFNSGTQAGKINFLPTGPLANQQLIQVTELDNLTNHTAPNPDNYFDFIEGITIKPDRGLVIFPVLEPFGGYLKNLLSNDEEAIRTYVFDALYSGTQQDAIQNYPRLNKYTLEGYYRSSGGADIPLNTFNLAEGSVTVTANGRALVEGQDYIVDYFGGKVTITNESILNSNQKIDVSYESASLYNVQSKTLLGARAEYSPTDEISLGLTALHLNERPFTQKTTLGDEPISNTLWGVDGALRTESEWLTKAIDKLPLLSTKQSSQIQGSVEFAQFVPGQPKQIKTDRGDSNIYLDDFESSKTPFSLMGFSRWKLAALPENNPVVPDPSFGSPSPLAKGFTRAKLAWYTIDQAFYQGFNVDIPEADLRNNYTRQVTPNEIFPPATRAFGNTVQQTFDLYYIPDERGPYNYSTDVDPNSGKLADPKKNWAGITRPVDVNNDFEATNVEFLEFWLMDPFLDKPSHTGGKLVFNVGRVSEDVLPDNATSQENGLPRNATDVFNIDTTAWGRVPIGLPPNQAFSNDATERSFQDIGIDGLDDENERSFFGDTTNSFLQELETILGPGSAAYQAVSQDPSNDNFVHFRDASYESRQAGILERYLKFNGMENNTPVSTGNQNFTIQGSQSPDNEDLNQNGNLNTVEEYYQYEVDLSPSKMLPGQNFVVDSIQSRVQVDSRNFVDVVWYQFRIPLRDPKAKAINNIANLKSVDFIRLFLSDWQDTVVLRMSEMQLVATQWRRYLNLNQLQNPCPIIGPEESVPFEIGSVSLEENSTKQPFNYTIPPGIERQALNGNTQPGYLQDERSLLMKVEDLPPGASRSVFRTTNIDLRNYERLKLWVHSEAVGMNSNFIDTGDATVFLRVGLDNEANYYEYEMPLTPSDPFSGDPQNITNIWPESNEMDILLSLFGVAKSDRDLNGIDPINPYSYTDGLPKGHRITVQGTPILSNVRNLMIGVRNPNPCGSGTNISAELWLNELRMTDFDKSSGWAGNASFSIGLADFGNIQASVSNRTPGFGSLEQKVSERSQENTTRYDLAGNFSLDKLFPQKWGIQLPMYATYGEQIIRPKFDPREPDVNTKSLLNNIEDPQDRDSVKETILDFTRNSSISFNNVRFGGPSLGGGPPGRGGGAGKKSFYSPSNFDFTFAYSKLYHRSAFIERLVNTNYRFAINYRYNFKPLSIKPFKSWRRRNLLSEFNFNPIPSSVAYSLNGSRFFEERKMRSGNSFGGNVNSTFSKNFLINQVFNLGWNITQSINLNFSATNVSRVDEVRGYQSDASEAELDSVGTLWQNLKGLGRGIGYTHNFAMSYQLPFSKFAWTSFISGTFNYAASFRWDQPPENNKALGAVIANTQTIQANGRLDLKGLYAKITPIKKVMDDLEKKRREKERVRQQKDRQREMIRQAELQGKEPPKFPESQLKLPEDTTRFKALKAIGGSLLQVLLSVQSLDLSFNRTAGTALPGYNGQSRFMGFDTKYSSPFDDAKTGGSLPPTPGFLFGSQQDIRDQAGQYGWISRDTTLSNFYLQSVNEQVRGRTSVELFKGFRIDINMDRNRTENFSELYRWGGDSIGYTRTDQLVTGSFNMTYIFLSSAFEKNETVSPAFEEFSDNRQIVSDRLGQSNEENVLNNGLSLTPFENGYSPENQDVLIPSLLAAYGPTKADKIGLTSFPTIPLPNWSINYNGINSFPSLKRWLTAITFRHTYRATYGLGSYNNNLNVLLDQRGLPTNTETKTDIDGNEFKDFYSTNNVQTVMIQEQFAPLAGLQLNFKNGVTATVDYKTDRRLAFSTGTMQLTELRGKDLSIMIGWRKDRLNWYLKLFGKDIELNNSLNAQFRLTMGDSRTRNRNLDSNLIPDYTHGSYNLIIEPSIDYVINTRVNIQIFFKQNLNKPYTTNTFRTSFTSGGFKIRFTLSG